LSEAEEIQVVNATTSYQDVRYERLISGQDILDFQKLVRRIPVSESVLRYAVNLARASRPTDKAAPDFIKSWINYGASLRASQFLILGGKARAVMQGRFNISVDDIRHLAPPVFRHRLLTNFHAESAQVSTDHIVQKLLEAVPVPKSGI